MNYHLPQMDAAEAMQAGMRMLRLSKSFSRICDILPTAWIPLLGSREPIAKSENMFNNIK